jgi:hypothetical protein
MAAIPRPVSTQTSAGGLPLVGLETVFCPIPKKYPKNLLLKRTFYFSLLFVFSWRPDTIIPNGYAYRITIQPQKRAENI